MSVFRFLNQSTNLISGRNLLTSRVVTVCEQQQAWISNKELEKLGIPQPPKKPLNPYLKFLQTTRPKLVEKHPNFSPHEVVKVAAQEWHKFDPEKKKELQKEYLSEIEGYLSEMEKYKNSITPEQKDLIQSTKKRKELVKERAKITQIKENLGKPKKPVSSFIKFMKEKMAQKNVNIKHNEWIRAIAKEWENLPQSEKNIYNEVTKLEMNNYKSDLLEWEQNMIRQGHIDVVRSKGLLNKQSKKTSNTTAP